MPNPRKIVKFNGIRYEAQTYKHDNSIVFDENEPNGSAQVGKALKMTGHSTVGLTTDGSGVVGKLLKVEHDGMCSVGAGGYVPFPAGENATLTLNSKIVGDLGPDNEQGFIRSVATGTAAELGVARGMIVDASNLEEVWVRLE